jgi:hypothetical protein
MGSLGASVRMTTYVASCDKIVVLKHFVQVSRILAFRK